MYNFELTVEFDDLPVRGNAIASGDDQIDKQYEDEILERLNDGDVWAWACVKVIASIEINGVCLESEPEYLGACSYENEAKFRECSYYSDMCATSKSNLNDKIEALQKALQFKS